MGEGDPPPLFHYLSHPPPETAVVQTPNLCQSLPTASGCFPAEAYVSQPKRFPALADGGSTSCQYQTSANCFLSPIRADPETLSRVVTVPASRALYHASMEPPPPPLDPAPTRAPLISRASRALHCLGRPFQQQQSEDTFQGNALVQNLSVDDPPHCFAMHMSQLPSSPVLCWPSPTVCVKFQSKDTNDSLIDTSQDQVGLPAWHSATQRLNTSVFTQYSQVDAITTGVPQIEMEVRWG